MLTLVSLVHVVVSLFLILVVLLQQGKGADLSVFGGGGSQAAFGARGATTILHKLTVFGFIAFIVTTVAIGLMQTEGSRGSVITDDLDAPVATVEEAAVEADEMTLDPSAATTAVDEAATSVEESAADVIEEGASEAADAETSEDGQ